MKTAVAKTICTIGLMGASFAALAGEAKAAPPQEPAGFIAGAVIGGFAAGPVGAVVGAGVGTWLGNRVHRASEARAAEGRVAQLEVEKQTLEGDKQTLQSGIQTLQNENSSLISQQTNLLAVNQSLSSKLEDMTSEAQTVGDAPVEPSGAYVSEVLDGLQGDVLFRTGSAEITPEIAHQIEVIAQAVAKSPQIKVRVDGYTDPRGGDEINMKLSQDRANAVRDLLIAAGVAEDTLEVNAYGKTQSVATDADGYALERRVRLTLLLQSPAAVAQVHANE
jgi:outer membrane protein OmpA-like peptidoglycan-associated protein